MSNQYRIFDWYLKDITNYTKTTYDGVVCASLSVNSETEHNTDTYLYNVIDVFPNNIGNTFSVEIAVDTDTPIEFAIDDGTYNLPVLVSNSGVLVEGETVELDATKFHYYWLCLKGDKAQLYIDNHKVWEGTPSSSSTSMMNFIGFKNYVSGTSTIYIKILRCTYGEKHPIDFDNLTFEVQVDTTDTFDSVNLRTYYNEGPVVYCREDANVRSIASGNKLARAFRIPLIPKQPDMPYFFFFRVRVLGDNNQASDWAYYMFNQPDNPFMFDTKVSLSELRGVQNNFIVFCEENKCSYQFITGTYPSYDGEEYIQCDISGGYWKKVSHSYFMLDPDYSEVMWSHMYDDRLPGDNVYTRYNKTGNISTILEADAIMIDRIHSKLLQTLRNSRIQSADDAVLESNFGHRYGLSRDYFDNDLEYRYALLAIQNAYSYPGQYDGMYSIFETITGVKPQIFEYKNLFGWVIWDETDMQEVSYSEKYTLKDDETIYPDFNEAVLYSENELDFGFDISIYNPFGMKLPEQMVKEIITSFKPAATSANIIMHDVDGREYQYPGFYYFANYGNDLYYPATFGE